MRQAVGLGDRLEDEVAIQNEPGPTLRALQVLRRRLHGHPSGHLAHRREKRQAPIGKLDRLVRYCVDLALHQVLGELPVRRQVRIRKELLPLVEAVILLGNRLFDLHEEVRSLEDLVGGLDHTRPA
jgi:hypothetical protein